MSTYSFHNLVIMILASLCFAYAHRRRIGIFWSLAWAWALISAVWVFQNPVPKLYSIYGLRLDQTSAQGFAFLLLIPAFTLYAKPRTFVLILHVLEVMCFVDAFILLFTPFVSGSGLWNAHSMDSAMLATMVPLTLFTPFSVAAKAKTFPREHVFRWLLALPMIFAVVKYGGSTGILALFLACIVQAYLTAGFLTTGLFGAAAIAAVVAKFGWAHLSYGADRIQPWLAYFDWWADNANVYTGTGVGTFWWLGIEVGEKLHLPEYFIWMHNEFLGALFESGLVGFLLFLSAFIATFLKGWKIRHLRAVLISVVPMLLFQYPFHFAASAIWLVALVRMIEQPGLRYEALNFNKGIY